MYKIIFNKHLFLVLLCAILSSVSLNAQYFQATMTAEGSALIVKIKPTGGDITNCVFANMEFFIRYPNTGNLSWATPIVKVTDIPDGVIQINNPYTTITEAGYTIVRFYLPPGTFTIKKTYTNNTEYEVFRTTATGLNSTTIEMMHRDDFTPYYLALDNEVGDVTGTQKFYGLGYRTEVGIQALTLDIVLPVELLEFEGKAEPKANVLNWTTLREENASHFVLEKAIGQAQKFAPIGELKANNNGAFPQYYSFTDAQYSSLDYYRLKMVNKNGQFSYSKTISLARVEDVKVDIFPNPATHFVNINVATTQSKNVSITLMDAMGKVVARQSKEKGTLDKNTFVFDVHNMPNGIYTASVTMDTQSSFHKIVKTK
jgi:Secretion system C-terminal sorting domain